MMLEFLSFVKKKKKVVLINQYGVCVFGRSHSYCGQTGELAQHWRAPDLHRQWL